MKKALFIIVALASVAISCTKSEVVKAPGRGREINFDTYIGKTPMTKAESADLAYLQRALPTEGGQGGFQVYAFLHNAIPETQNPETGEIDYTDISTIGTVSAYMDKIVNWVGPEEVVDETTGETVTKNGYWDYPGVVYWPDHTTQRKLAFAAYALNAQGQMEFDNNEATKTGKSYTNFTYTVPDAVKDQKDLLVTPFLPNQGLSENVNAASVNLNFKHLLTRVGFQVVANQDGKVEIDIQEVTLHGKFPKKGKVDLTGKAVIEPVTAEGSEFAESYTLFPTDNHFVTLSSTVPTDIFENKIVTTETTTNEDGTPGESVTTTTDSNDKSNRYMMIMPSEQPKYDEDGDGIYEKGAADIDNDGTVSEEEITKALPGAYIEVKYQLTDADPQTARVALDGWNFAAGKSYNFIFKVSTSSIEFTVEVESWNEFFGAAEDGTYPNGNGIFTLTPILG